MRRAWSDARRTGHSPRPWREPATRTGRPGIVPPPRTARTRTSSRHLSAPRFTLSAAAARDQGDDRLLRADIDRLRGRIEVNIGSASEAHRIFMRAARAVAADDPARALEMAMTATVLAAYGADSGVPPDQAANIPTDASPDDTPRTRCLKHLLVGMTEASRGHWAAAAAPLRDALRSATEVSDPDILANLGNAALQLGDDQAAHRYYTAVLSGARESGAGMLVLYGLPRLAFPQLLTGQWTAAASSADEAFALAVSAGQRPLTAAPLAWLTLLAALQGKPEYDALLAAADRCAPPPAPRAGDLRGPAR